MQLIKEEIIIITRFVKDYETKGCDVGETKEIRTVFTPEYTGSAGIRWFEESYGIISVKRVNSIKTEVKGLKRARIRLK